MGAISGVFGPAGDGAIAEAGTAVFGKLSVYRFDTTREWTGPQGHMGCGIRYNTPESLREILPRQTEEHSWVIAADAIIDNRSELLQAFGIPPEQGAELTDSELIVRAYRLWGEACPLHLIGDYTFAIWDPVRQALYLARDAMGARTLYYTCGEGRMAFCTALKPLLGLFGSRPALNERWIADFLAIPGIPQETQCEETVYEGVRQLPPAHYATWSGGKLDIVRYWNAAEIKPIRYKTDEAYVEAFRRVFDEAVACRLRTAGDTGILLSGGMDSTSIASTAAPLLAAQGKKLYGFTSVPLPDFKSGEGYSIYDETREVELVREAYSNLEVQYNRLEGRSCLSDMDELVQVFEQPYKVFQNMTWYHPFLRTAADRGCRVMLNGQWGNYSISYGHFTVHLLTLYKKGRLLSAAREISRSSKLAEAPRRRMFRQALSLIRAYRRQAREDRRNGRRTEERLARSLVNPAKAAECGTPDRMAQMERELRFNRLIDYEEERKARSSVLPLAHIGAMETKLSLADGITIRDPSRDRRVYEFCLAIPPEQFVRDGQDRYLLRRAMKGRLPDPIRLNYRYMGRQSVDWLKRLEPQLPHVLDEAERLLESSGAAAFLNASRLRDDLEAIASGETLKPEERIMWDIMVAIILRRFIDSFRGNEE